MAGGTPKPFACTSEGCTMTFTNEDHLNVHQRKHEMVLNLGLKNSSIVADQTPTPTRFLRNCEEVGLFQDLQNVNPFEETFKKAVEMVKTGSLPIPDLPEDDTLHTPHIFPIPEENVYSQTLKNNKIELNLTVETMNTEKNNSVLTLSNTSPEHIFTSMHKNPVILINDKPNEEESRKPKFVVREKKFPSAKTNKILTRQNTTVTAKEKLQQILQSKQNNKSVILLPNLKLSDKVVPYPIMQTMSSDLPILPKISSVAVPITAQNTELTMVSVLQTVSSELSIFPKTSKSVKAKNSESNDKRKLDLLERNRAAATRCRARKKEWIGSLENKFNIVVKENDKLKKENSNLHSEIQQLKALLLAHKDCSVTKAMNSGQNIPIGPPTFLTIQVPRVKEENNSKELKTIKSKMFENQSKTSVIVLNDSLIS